jgi:hypothetical protein
MKFTEVETLDDEALNYNSSDFFVADKRNNIFRANKFDTFLRNLLKLKPLKCRHKLAVFKTYDKKLVIDTLYIQFQVAYKLQYVLRCT